MKFILSFLLLIICIHCFGQYKYKKVFNLIKDFGAQPNSIKNNTAAFNAAAAAINKLGGNCTLVIPQGLYFVGEQVYQYNGSCIGKDILHLIHCNNVQIIGSVGTEIRYLSGLKFGSFHPKTHLKYTPPAGGFANNAFQNTIGYCLFFDSCNNVTASNLNLNGNNKALEIGGYFGDTGIQLSHDGVYVFNSNNVTLNNINASHFGRDGIFISTNNIGDRNLKNTIINNCVCTYNGRDALSWDNGEGLFVTNCTFSNSGKGAIKSSPLAGCDIEAEIVGGNIRNGHFINCKFIDNAGCGFVADSGDSMGVDFDSCTFVGINAWSCWVTKPRYSFRSCIFNGGVPLGYNSPNSIDATKYYYCLFTDQKYNGIDVFNRFLIENTTIHRTEYHNCKFESHTHSTCYIANSDSDVLQNQIMDHCIFNVYSPSLIVQGISAGYIHGVTMSNCTFNINYAGTNLSINNFFQNVITDLGGNKIYSIATPIKK